MKPNSKKFDNNSVVIKTLSILLLVSIGLTSIHSNYFVSTFDQEGEMMILPEAESQDSLEEVDNLFDKNLNNKENLPKKTVVMFNLNPTTCFFETSDYCQGLRRPPKV